jgi:hypothetical protein
MWDEILQTFREVLAKAESTYLSKAKSKIATPQVFDTVVNFNYFQALTAPKKRTPSH